MWHGVGLARYRLEEASTSLGADSEGQLTRRKLGSERRQAKGDPRLHGGRPMRWMPTLLLRRYRMGASLLVAQGKDRGGGTAETEARGQDRGSGARPRSWQGTDRGSEPSPRLLLGKNSVETETLPR
jgi:hypothetical protein